MNQKSSNQGRTGRGRHVNSVTYVMLFLALGAMVFIGVCNPQAYQDGLTGNAGKVAGEIISNKDFVRAYERLSAQKRGQYGEDYNPATLKVAGSVLELLAEERVMYLEAEKLGLRATDPEIVEAFGGVDFLKDESGNFSEDQFRNFLRSHQYTEAALQEEIRRSISVEHLRNLLFQSVFTSSKTAEMDYKIAESKLSVEYIKLASEDTNPEVSEAEKTEFLKGPAAKERISAWYEAHESEYSQPKKVRARHILVAYNGARNASAAASKRTREEAEKRADEILKEAKDADQDFAILASKKTDEPTGKTRGGDLGFFAREAMVKEFSDAAFSLKPGSLSEVVESPFGFHIIKVVATQEAKDISLDEATDGIIEQFIRKEKGPQIAGQRAQNVLDTLKRGEDAAELLKQYRLNWEKTGEFSYTAGYLPGLGSDQAMKTAIFSLSEEAPLYNRPFKSGNNFFILRLAGVRHADMEGLADKRKEQIAATESFSRGYRLFEEFRKNAMESYDQAKAIYKNPAYLALDESAAQE